MKEEEEIGFPFGATYYWTNEGIRNKCYVLHGENALLNIVADNIEKAMNNEKSIHKVHLNVMSYYNGYQIYECFSTLGSSTIRYYMFYN